MEIHGNITTPPPVVAGHKDVRRSDPGGADLDGAASGRAAGDGADASGGARVALSGKARDMLAIKQAVDEVPDVRAGRVADLKTQVAAGTYDVRGRLVAQALARQTLVEAVA
jgi:flagellar biosynthesis anti-sigma factor FlgM